MKKIIFFLVISNYQCMFGASCTTLKRSIDELKGKVAAIKKDVEKIVSSKPGVASSSSSTVKVPPPPPPPPPSSPKGSVLKQGKKEVSPASEQSPVKSEIKKPETTPEESIDIQKAMRQRRRAMVPEEEFGEAPEEFGED